MRVAIVTHVPRDERLGTAKVPLREAEELRALGVEVLDLFAADLPPPRGGRVAQLSAPGRVAAALFRRAARFDVVDIAGFDGWAYARAARLFRPQQGVVVRSNGLWFRALAADLPPGQRRSIARQAVQRAIYCRWERASITAAHAVRVMSSPDRDDIIHLRWRDPDSVFVVSPGVDDAFAVGPELAPRRGVAFVGSWIYRKGNTVAAQALSVLMRERPELPVAVLGSGAPPEAVRASFPDELRRRVQVIPVAAPHELAARMAEHGVMLFPTRYEGYGMLVAEAMRAGLAVVTTQTGAGVDLVEDGKTGMSIPPDDPAAAVRAVERLLDDDSLRRRIAAAGVSKVSAQTWRRTALGLVAVYEAALRTARGR